MCLCLDPKSIVMPIEILGLVWHVTCSMSFQDCHPRFSIVSNRRINVSATCLN